MKPSISVLVGIVLAYPFLTFEMCDALYFYVGNHIGYNSNLIPYIFAAQYRIVQEETYDVQLLAARV